MWLSESAIRELDDVVKVLMPILALTATLLGVRGKTWDESRKRPTKVGYTALATGLFVAAISLFGWWTGDQVKSFDQRIADSRQAKAVSDQIARDKELKDVTVHGLEETNVALKQAGAAQETSLNIALRQLPVDEIDLWFKRKDIESILPQTLQTKTFAFEKPIGDAPVDNHQVSFETWRPNGLDSLLFGKAALDAFHPVYYALCGIDLSPSSVPEELVKGSIKISGDDLLTRATLDRNFLIYQFSPQHLSASYFQRNKVRLRINRGVALALGGADLPKTRPCLAPTELDLRLRVRTFGFSADTNFFHPKWRNEFDGWVSLSPPLNLRTSNDRDQPPPAR
jgi:hypothetical protein